MAKRVQHVTRKNFARCFVELLRLYVACIWPGLNTQKITPIQNEMYTGWWGELLIIYTD